MNAPWSFDMLSFSVGGDFTQQRVANGFLHHTRPWSHPPCKIVASRCGSTSRGTTSAAHPLSTTSAVCETMTSLEYFWIRGDCLVTADSCLLAIVATIEWSDWAGWTWADQLPDEYLHWAWILLHHHSDIKEKLERISTSRRNCAMLPLILSPSPSGVSL